MIDRNVVERFSSLLGLVRPPVGLAFVDEIPLGVERTTTGVPSACTFWRLAEQGVFYATASDHQQCPIGMITMGFLSPQALGERGRSLVQTMANVGYFSPEELRGLPVVEKKHTAIVYGRLDRFPLEPDIVLALLNAQQAMLVAEAQGAVNWLEGGQLAFGRPTCGIIPRTLRTGQPSLSFGCVGARTYVGMEPSQMVLALAGSHFAELVARLEGSVTANESLAPFHAQQKASFPA
ncbi:MAG: DUF169 domain-containing protein [Thermogemmatispora sp.]|uniref:DUF169 domain-containing protein n=1 Tax=Thermogemmatispora aurantia TaxID=2045279 RepID=A0A5J4K7B1_9CHLR|nr:MULTISPECIES: DUF169 domain-containing protein [Thermogemmatispora]MBE3565703.1 DUF169 domain-containing protein [Thermogemmatispora sp.]GER82962.1 hypothetical protein KTAU_15990 [Thermogemmatispora aurantia]